MIVMLTVVGLALREANSTHPTPDMRYTLFEVALLVSVSKGLFSGGFLSLDARQCNVVLMPFIQQTAQIMQRSKPT